MTSTKGLILVALLRMGACRDCYFDNAGYLEGQYLQGTCFQPWCNDGTWEFTGQHNYECGKCYFGGEPLVYTFDILVNIYNGVQSGVNNGPMVTDSNLMSVDGLGEYAMTQLGLIKPDDSSDPPKFGVTGHFTSDPAAGGPCGVNTVHGKTYTNCIDGFIYYEDNKAVKVQLDRGIFKVYWRGTGGYVGWDSLFEWNNPITIETGMNYLSSGILVIKQNMVVMGCRDSIIVIGSKGFTVTLCKEDAYSAPGYPWSGIYAMPHLQSTSTYPTDNGLYGLCNSWTIKAAQTPNSFYQQDGAGRHDWQRGLTTDHNGGGDIRKLWTAVANTWKV